jgi:Alpha-glutamyl/putrescinyl thymine pyrophosphorylase clade 3
MRGDGVQVRREGRAQDDGYRSNLVPGLRSSQDARHLAREIGFASGRLLAMATCPPDIYADIRAQKDTEQATWACFLITYLSPVQGEDPFLGIRGALGDWHSGELPDLDGVALGPRTSHDPARGLSTLLAYRQWAERSGSQALAFEGDPSWSPERRFERIFERLALPGYGRFGRYELLLTLGRLGIYDLQADSLHLVGAPGSSSSDPATLAAKRVFGIGDQLNLERRARTLAQAAQIPIEALDLALANWGSDDRATLGFDPDVIDEDTSERAQSALGL